MFDASVVCNQFAGLESERLVTMQNQPFALERRQTKDHMQQQQEARRAGQRVSEGGKGGQWEKVMACVSRPYRSWSRYSFVKTILAHAYTRSLIYTKEEQSAAGAQ